MPSQQTTELISQLEALGAFVDEADGDDEGIDELDGRYCPIDDTLLQRVLANPDFQKLFSLYLVDCPITDRACESIAKCSNLHYLELCGTTVTDLGVRKLPDLSELVSLRLRGTQIKGGEELGLSKLRHLVEVVLAETAIGDSVVRELSKLPMLSHVFLQNTRVSANVIDILLRMRSLKFLSLIGNESCASRIAELRLLRPEVHVDF